MKQQPGTPAGLGGEARRKRSELIVTLYRYTITDEITFLREEQKPVRRI